MAIEAITDSILTGLQSMIGPLLDKLLSFIPLDQNLLLVIIAIVVAFYVSTKIVSRTILITALAVGTFFLLKFLLGGA